MVVRLWDVAMAVRPVLLVWMFAIFIYIAWRTLSSDRSDRQHDAMIPLRDGDADRGGWR